MIMTMTPRPRWTPDAAWAAVLARDPAQDGSFVFAVRTTGIYCRPSCPARRARRTNVTFFNDGSAARNAGYRACLRCQPDQPATDPVALAHQLLESTEERLTLDQLAIKVSMSAGHLQRRFKARYGHSPRAFQEQRRRHRLRSALRGGMAVSRATYDAGYGSSSRVYERAADELGMTPGQFARGARGLNIRYTIIDSPVAPRLLVAVTDRGVCAVLPGTSDPTLEAALAREFPHADRQRIDQGDQWLADLVRRVAREIRGSAGSTEPLALDLHGTAFQERVWQALLEVPRGDTRSYTEIARTIGNGRAVRAVAGAIAHNRLAIVVPCHRVIREDGTLAGYRWGLTLKERLLAVERGSSRRG